MLQVPVFNTNGEKIETLEVDERVFGSQVNVPLLKQAVVAYHANKRLGTVATKGRGMVDGSTRKLFRQKGTGRARRGAIRTPVVRGGGVTFNKTPHSHRKGLPKKMRQAALKSAILAKILGEDLMVVDGLAMDAPKTQEMAKVAGNLKINRSCLLTLGARDKNIYLSCRNIQDITVRTAEELNAFDVATRMKMLVTREAMVALMGGEAK
jgi:large subunit ribosomal protein L4